MTVIYAIIAFGVWYGRVGLAMAVCYALAAWIETTSAEQKRPKKLELSLVLLLVAMAWPIVVVVGFRAAIREMLRG